MREDTLHPDKRTSLRVVLYIPEDSPETWKGIRFALPLHSQALRGMVWDWRSFHSLVPKVASFGVGHKEEREHKPFTRRRELATDCVVFEGGASPPSTPFLMPTHQEKRRAKKNPPPTSQKVDIFIPPWYTVYAEERQGFFDWPSRTTYHFSRLRGLRVLYFPYLRVLWIFPPMCSPMFPLVALQHHLSKDNVTEGWHPPPSVI